MKVGLFYYSKTGNTEKIASMIEEKIKENKVNIEMIEIQPVKHPSFLRGGYTAFREKELPIINTDLNMKPYDLLIVGSPIWAGKPAPFIKAFLKNATEIKGKKIAFFFTCAGDPEKQKTPEDVVEKWSKEKETHMIKKPLMIQMKKGEIISNGKKINGFIMDIFTK